MATKPDHPSTRPRFDSRSLVFWPALPLIAAQGLWLRRHAYRAGPAPGPDRGEVGQGPLLRMLALGDSIIAGVGIADSAAALPAQFALALSTVTQRQVQWQASGQNGADASSLRTRLAEAGSALCVCDLLLVSIGVNDVTGLRSRRRFAADLENLLTTVAEYAPQARLLLAAIPPLDCFPLLPAPLKQLMGLRSRQLDAVLARVAADNSRVLHTPMPFAIEAHRFGRDGFHPNAESCAEWAQWLVRCSLERWPELGSEHAST